LAEKRYFWLKLQEDFFKSKRIKKLRKIAGGDTYTIIYLKMQLLSIKNKGILEYTGLEPSFAEEIALDLDEAVDDVTITINYLLTSGLMETSDNIEYMLPFAVNNVGSESDSAERMRRFREKNDKTSLCDNNVQKCEHNVLYISSSNSISKSKDRGCGGKETDPDSENIKTIVDYLNQKAGTHYKTSSESTKKHIRARLKEGYSLEDFRSVIDKRCAEWMGTEMQQYLRPDTIFGTKFESYLNAPSKKKKETLEEMVNRICGENT